MYKLSMVSACFGFWPKDPIGVHMDGCPCWVSVHLDGRQYLSQRPWMWTLRSLTCMRCRPRNSGGKRAQPLGRCPQRLAGFHITSPRFPKPLCYKPHPLLHQTTPLDLFQEIEKTLARSYIKTKLWRLQSGDSRLHPPTYCIRRVAGTSGKTSPTAV